MLNDIVNEFLGSNAGNQLVQSITGQHGIDATKAQDAIRATAQGGAEAMKKQGLDFATLAKGFTGLGGGMPNDLAKNVTDYVCKQTGLSPAIGNAIVGMVLPKLMEFAKGRGAPV